MLTNIIRLELKRILGKKKLLVLGILGIGLLITGVVIYLEYNTPQRTSFEAFSFATGYILPLALPFLAGLSTGDILAEDRHLGLVQLFMSRGVLPYQYISGKAIGSVVGQICFTGGLLITFLLTTFLLFPAGPILEYAADFAKAFAATNPMVYCLVLLLIYVCAATAFSGIALLVSVWIENIFVVVVTPTILYFAALYSLSMSLINPYCYLALNEGVSSSPSFTFLKVVGYWITISVTVHVLAVMAFSLKKDHS